MLLQQCHPNLAGSLVIARGTEWGPHCFVVLLCCRLPPKLGDMAKVYRIDRCFVDQVIVQCLSTSPHPCQCWESC